MDALSNAKTYLNLSEKVHVWGKNKRIPLAGMFGGYLKDNVTLLVINRV